MEPGCTVPALLEVQALLQRCEKSRSNFRDSLSEYDEKFIHIFVNVQTDLPITLVEVIHEPSSYRFRRSHNESASTKECGSHIHSAIHSAIVGILTG